MPPKQRKAASASTSAVSSTLSSRASSPRPPKQPFRFFDLPSELRLRIYEEVLYVNSPPIDLDSMNYRAVLPRMTLFLVSKRMHEEAYRVFYAQPIRLYPSPASRFFHTKKPLLQRLPVRYREVINTMELRLGPGWSAPPRCQNTLPSLGLIDCTNMRNLKIFIELDPSVDVFNGFRGKNSTKETYKWFCVDLLTGIFDQVPSLENVEIDAFPAVKKDSMLVTAVRELVEGRKKKLIWGPLRGWEKEDDEPGLIGLEGAMASMSLSGNEAPRIIAAQA